MPKSIKASVTAIDQRSQRYSPTRITRQALAGFMRNDATQYAGSMAYFAVLSIFQLLVLGIIGFSFFMDAGTARGFVIEQVVANSPVDAQTVSSIIDGIIDTRGGITVLSILFLIWSSLGAFSALSTGVGRAFVAVPRRGFVAEKLIGLLLMSIVGVLAVTSLLAGLITSALLEIGREQLALIPGGSWTLQVLGFLAPLMLIFVAFYIIYRLIPNRKVRRRAALVGAIVAALLWTVLRFGFTFYATSVARYDSAFGPISTAITLLVFLYFASIIVLFGAEVTHAVIIDDELAQGTQRESSISSTSLPAGAGRTKRKGTLRKHLVWPLIALVAFGLGLWRGRRSGN